MYIGPEQALNISSMIKTAVGALSDLDVLSDLDARSELNGRIITLLTDALVQTESKQPPDFRDVKQAVSCYVRLRDDLSVERKSWETHEKSIKDQMEVISMWLRDRGDELGVDSFSTPSGTAYRNVKTSYRIDSWDKFAKWIIESDNLQCLEKRPAKLAVKEIYDQSGDMPPGLYQHVEVEFNVRRPTKS